MRTRGFTLVEVLVALVIVAAGAAAVLSSLNTAAVSTTYLRDKTFAGWIAENRVAQLRLQTTPPQNGKTEGELDFAGQRWRWRAEISNVAIPGLRRIDVSVRPVTPGAAAAGAAAGSGATADEGWTVTLSGVLGRDLAGPGGLIDWDGQPGTGPGGGSPGGGAGGAGPGGGSGGSGGSGSGSGSGSGGGGGPGPGGGAAPARDPEVGGSTPEGAS